MKVFAFSLAIVGVTAAASLNAQSVPRPGTVITGQRTSNDCTYNRTTNSVGDIIFGRTNLNTSNNCQDVYSRNDGSWYQVGNGRSQVYERRVRDNYGNLIIQRARRNPNGTFTILNSRIANNNDKQWKKAEKQREKEIRKAQKRNGNDGYNRADNEGNQRYNDANYRYDQFGNRVYVGSSVNTNRDYDSKQKDHGKGKGKKDRD
ncbi:MAG: hypothetical protein ACJ8AK_03870 [Gemmatimonadaceae bacterium]|jgi:hypothetical protein